LAGTIVLVSAATAQRTAAAVLRLLAGCFFVVGLLFLIVPDGVLSVLDDVGDWFGTFDPAPDTGAKLWLTLSFAYMMTITAVAVVAASDVVRYRALILILVVAKTTSSLVALGFYIFDEQVFAYLLNFIVDGSLVLTALWCWSLAGKAEGPGEVEARAPA
jgi:hypothetical protein